MSVVFLAVLSLDWGDLVFLGEARVGSVAVPGAEAGGFEKNPRIDCWPLALWLLEDDFLRVGAGVAGWLWPLEALPLAIL